MELTEMGTRQRELGQLAVVPVAPTEEVTYGPESAHSTCESQTAWVEYKPVLSQMDRLLDERYRAKLKSNVTASLQAKVYNFLERPTGWKCFIYHFTV